MATIPTTGLMTFEEFEQLPESAGKQELLNGELVELPPAKKKHNYYAHRLCKCLDKAITSLDASRADDTSDVMGFRVTRDPDSWLIPDVSVAHPGQPGEEYLEGAPFLAVEVISQSNRADHVETKVKTYL